MFMNHEIVQLEASQIQAASEVLGDAFKDDPVFRSFAFWNDRKRFGTIEWISRLMLKYARHYNTVYTTTQELKGVSIWIPPGQFPLNDFRLLLLGAYALPFKFRLGKLLQFILLFLKLEELHKANAPQPHWYLLMLGVHPCYQSRGVGSFLMQPILEKADREGIPCYLETSTEGAVRFYKRHNFEVVNIIDFPQDSFQIWTMRREPRLNTIDNAS
jgi:ribosomal protein S18 acetylase RimI-like enzyme